MSQRLLPARKRTLAARNFQWRPLMSGYRSKADVGNELTQCLLMTHNGHCPRRSMIRIACRDRLAPRNRAPPFIVPRFEIDAPLYFGSAAAEARSTRIVVTVA